MSKLVFTSPSGSVELAGAEYHHLLRIAGMPGEVAWDVGGWNRAEEIMALLQRDRDNGHLFDAFEKAKAPGGSHLWRDFLDSLRTSLKVGNFRMVIAGVELRTGNCELNTALAFGSDPVRLAAKLAHWADRFPFVEGPDRAWMAGVIEEGLRTGIYRRALNGYDLGWPAVQEFLRCRDDEPVVAWYTVADSFPSRSVADWAAPQMPEDWMPEWARSEQGRAEWDAAEYSDDVRRSYWDEHVSDLWDDLPEAESWERSLRGLRAKRPWIRLYPDLTHYTFHFGVNIFDLFAPDRDERVRAAASED
jgi:hypothetical protein